MKTTVKTFWICMLLMLTCSISGKAIDLVQVDDRMAGTAEVSVSLSSCSSTSDNSIDKKNSLFTNTKFAWTTDVELGNKPDLVAPGSGIVSCNAWYRKNHFCSVNHPYTAKNGTSMAVPAVSAAAALLWEKEPHLTNEQVRERLLYHAQDLGENWGMQGWGMLHVGRALKG